MSLNDESRSGDHPTGFHDSAPSVPRHPRPGWLVNRIYASSRCEPLGPCSCIRDPDLDRHHCRDDHLTLAGADAVIAAAEHLENTGLRPLFDHNVLRAAWHLTPEHRERIESLARRDAA